ncbi:isoleucyl-tRNA ligase [Anaplasma phagocytophilum str. HGE1]|uniref:Isoleucine--tRNA ligase n=1 Tax=Anaplasma phagocytophilum (strain HZ) TaxID=212042 RepID=Q2GJS8_ANAPZ|nr:isoleucyl-tRNA synthetase [Anaplasma phagocytophilum str. HZ]AGR78924.1 isoleucyl-tRNA synthase [Anaplasma phagocytophilum str. HZ2]AGR80171.1 isoleucyl-tRNA synthase [Anaplasma phagocytophilum str. JM]AGR81426.1 isoleucyl-tRNA synthase [Anaplasma phagocytophilum str. Dog2]EOA61080.1 isoleucyl-tRNA ligase [Anaplasma phagocytophilum str. HGE1]
MVEKNNMLSSSGALVRKEVKYYPKVSGNPEFASIERDILEYWDKNKIFEKSVENKPKTRRFVFYDGPPFANGLPHYGHLLTGFIKDAVARYKSMRGFRVDRRFGWDCHGLPVEMLSEKELNVSGRTKIEEFGIEKFNANCRNSIMRFTQKWKEYVTRQARWVDFDNGYKTMDKDFMESVMWAFYKLWDRGLVYESLRVVPYSWACQTPLSNFETKLDNAYREKVSKTIVAKFELRDKPSFIPPHIESCKILAWTTTPWTLVANFALAVNPKMSYVAASLGKEMLIFSEGYVEHFQHYCKRINQEYTEVCKLTGQDLVSLAYNPLFPYFADQKNAFRILGADFVTEGTGTGIVHIAPGFGEDDFILCQKHSVPSVDGNVSQLLSIICPIDDAGVYTAAISDFAGCHVFDATDKVIMYLKERGSWLETSTYTHSYPHCWRTDTPLIYRAMPSWYIEVTKLKERMMQLNKGVNWIPDNVRDGQFGKWLEGIRDWSISRNRFWGAPVPVWKSDDPKYPRIDVYGSIKKVLPNVRALEEDFGPIDDLHRPYIDDLVRPNPDDPSGKSMMRRVPDVLDCWFESGSMPFAQVHYPFENKELFEENFPADFITEYIAQTRGWFYTLFVLSTGIFDKHPFESCICHGVILDIQGQKLSKRLNNYLDPMEVFERFGADSLRFMLLSSSVSTGGDLLLDQDGQVIRDVLKNVVKPIWNSYSFFTVYANADKIRARVLDSLDGLNNIMDKYILHECMHLVQSVLSAMESIEGHDPYDIKLACTAIVQFSDKLNNWYIRRCRERFWATEKTQDKFDAYNTLYTVLYYFSRVIAPFLPFISEAIWLGLDFQQEESVHLSDFPAPNALQVQEEHVKNAENMQLVMDICSHALSLRNIHNLRIRQPLSSMKIHVYNCAALSSLPTEYKNVILSELNIKELVMCDNVQDVAFFDLKLNFPLLGKRIPEKIKEIIPLVKAGVWEMLPSGELSLGSAKNEQYIFHADEFSMSLKVRNEYSCPIISSGQTVGIVTIDPELTKDLLLEGIARDIVRYIQQGRKQCDLDMLSLAKVCVYTCDSETYEAILKWEDFIKKQTLLSTLEYSLRDSITDAKVAGYTQVTDEKDLSIFLQG